MAIAHRQGQGTKRGRATAPEARKQRGQALLVVANERQLSDGLVPFRGGQDRLTLHIRSLRMPIACRLVADVTMTNTFPRERPSGSNRGQLTQRGSVECVS